MSILLLIARLVLALVFASAGIAKLTDPAGSRKAMTDFGVPEFLGRPLAWLLPWAELICAVALVPVASAWWGASGVLAMLVLFIAGICISLARGRRPDCHCFGQLHSSPIGWDTLARNVVFAVIAGLVVSQGPANAGASILDWSNRPSRSESVAFALAFAVAVLAAFQLWALVHVLRQNGRLLLRIEALESKAGGAVEAPPLGLPVNTNAPGFSLKDLDGETVSLDILRKKGKPILLMFSEPGCDACDAALPELSQWQREYGDRLLIVPISRGEAKTNRMKSDKYGVENMLLQDDREVAGAYQADSTPSAVLVTDGRIASALTVGTDAIRGLVARAVLPPPVKKGELVPSLRLPDLNGVMIDLAKVRRRTLILFWNPACGFCQQMLDDLKAWERSRPKDALELLVISAGSLESNREQGFRASVLLDPYFAASQVFNTGGTPSAIVIDENGRVASDVGVGAPDVLAMAGAVPAGVAAA